MVQLVALERRVELDLQQIVHALSRQDPDGQETAVTQ